MSRRMPAIAAVCASTVVAFGGCGARGDAVPRVNSKAALRVSPRPPQRAARRVLAPRVRRTESKPPVAKHTYTKPRNGLKFFPIKLNRRLRRLLRPAEYFIKQGRYVAAAKRLYRVYIVYPVPILLYNIAWCYDLGSDPVTAGRFYRRFLNEVKSYRHFEPVAAVTAAIQALKRIKQQHQADPGRPAAR